MTDFVESRFRAQVDKALTSVRTILENNRVPQYPADVPHRYDDKYGLAEFLTNTAVAAQLNALEALGLNEGSLKQLLSWAASRSVSLRLKAEERCVFVKETTRKVEGNTEHVTKYQNSTGYNSQWSSKVVTTITEYFWKFTVDYEIFAFSGNNVDDKVVLQGRTGDLELITTVKTTPHPSVTVQPSIDVQITWLLQQLNAKLQTTFAIDRTNKNCRTPRRNPEIDSALYAMMTLKSWASRVDSYFTGTLFPKQDSNDLKLSAIIDDSVFVPVVPLFETESARPIAKSEKNDGAIVAITAPATYDAKKSGVLSVGDVNKFLAEQKRSLSEKFTELAKMFPEVKLITAAEANILVAVKHMTKLSTAHADGVEYIEDMLWKQLVAAIGKEVTPVDFTNYMRFHNRKLFRGQYEPSLFCYAVRRPDHYPEGTLSIEQNLSDGTMAEPILTSVRKIEPAHPMRFPINAATNVTFGGPRYLHAWISHSFSGDSGLSLNLIARARQFSSFILLVGRISSATVFDPKGAIIIQNKDDLKIPLMLEQIPTPKEFRDAIESLSPEQQAFCKAYRAMQLESSLFGICIIQIKPQLEKLLKLPEDSLTKEIRLTQDLLEMFIKYQIPSDLLTYDGPDTASSTAKIDAVKSYVSNMQSMINDKRQSELQNIAEERVYATLSSPQPVPAMPLQQQYAASPRRMMSAAPTSFSMASPPSTSFSMAGPPPPPPAAAPAPMPAPPPSAPAVPSTPSTPSAPEQAKTPSNQAGDSDTDLVGVVDFTKVPAELDKRFDKLDTDSALRPTIINIGKTWVRI
jgi:hypothetical protein